jgi:phosphomannomutase
MALVLDFMAASGQSVGELADALPRYEIVKSKVSLRPELLEAAFTTLENHYAQAKANRQDGLRLDFADSWLLVRASNTEPIVRVIAEAPSPAAAQKLVEEASTILQQLSATTIG